jgi:hypothetical protein
VRLAEADTRMVVEWPRVAEPEDQALAHREAVSPAVAVRAVRAVVRPEAAEVAEKCKRQRTLTMRIQCRK